MVRALFHFVSVVIGDLFQRGVASAIAGFFDEKRGLDPFFLSCHFFSLYFDMRSQSCL